MGRYRACIKKLAVRVVPQSWQSYLSFIRNDPSRKDDIPLTHKISMWRRGFWANRYNSYNLKDNPSHLYLSDYLNVVTHPKNGRFTHAIDCKLYLPFCLKDFQEHLPQHYFLLTQAHVIELFRDKAIAAKRDPRSLDPLLELVESRRCVGKPIWKSRGEGVSVLEKRSGRLLVDNRPCSTKELRSLFQSLSDYIITEFVQQHPYAANLNESTTNTIRLLTCWDKEKNTPFIARGIHRMGRGRMYGADNIARGGLAARIDLAEGTLGHIALPENGRIRYVEAHPDTGARVYGMKIPHFEKMVSTILDMCYALNFIGYMAWDAVITQESFKVLEVNSNPDVYGMQLFEPLLADRRLLKFYQQFVTTRTRKFFMK